MNSFDESNIAKMEYLKIMEDFIPETIEYNIFWIFWRTGAWLTAPRYMRKVDSLLAIEVKKMIEYYSIAVMLKKDKNIFNEKVSVSYENLLYTMKKKFIDQVESEEKFKAIDEFLKALENKHIKYKSTGLNKMVDKYANAYKSLYEKLNYIQHHSLIPSAQTAFIKEEIFIKTKRMMKEMHEITKTLYTDNDGKKEIFDELFEVFTIYVG